VHAAALAQELAITRVIVPLHPGVLSAAGLLAAPVEHQAAVAFNAPLAQVTRVQLAQIYAELDARCAELMAHERVAGSRIERHYLADVCYVGQSYHLEVALALTSDDALERLARDFYQAHDRIYGHSAPGPIQFVNLRAVHQAPPGGSAAAADYEPAGGDAFKGTRAILTARSGEFVRAGVYERSRIVPGTRFQGPAIFEQADTTTVLDCGWQAEIARGGSLILTAAQ
jgi:N-methylhydantoinase A/oxoprolinase/acetone carboxylase beta subunit